MQFCSNSSPIFECLMKWALNVLVWGFSLSPASWCNHVSECTLHTIDNQAPNSYCTKQTTFFSFAHLNMPQSSFWWSLKPLQMPATFYLDISTTQAPTKSTNVNGQARVKTLKGIQDSHKGKKYAGFKSPGLRAHRQFRICWKAFPRMVYICWRLPFSNYC